MSPTLWGDQVVVGANGYAPRGALQSAYDGGHVAMSWWLGPRLSSVRLKGGGIWKARERMEPLPQGVDPDRWLRAIESAGVKHPSSYADCYHQLAPPSPRLQYTFNGLFSDWAGGPWSEARMTGSFRGPWWRYDLRSAYRWASTLGLPDPGGFVVQRGGQAQDGGLWWLQLRGRTNHLPSIFRGDRPVVMSTEEIETYQVQHDVIRGVTWSTMLGRDYVETTLKKLPCSKESGRAYWGRWVARDPLRVETSEREWQVPNMAANYIWGWLIVGRVRAQMWKSAQRAAHVYVDEVVVPHELPTGESDGDWHLKEAYPRGVTVHRTGWYAGRAADAPTMQTGIPRKGRAA